MDYTTRIPDPKETTELDDTLLALAESRRDVEVLKQELADIISEALAKTDHARVKELLANAIENTEKLYESAVLVAQEMDTKGQTLPSVVTVKNFKQVTVFDPEVAREWSMKNFTPAMKLDTKMFEKAVKDGNVPSTIAEVKEVRKAQIAQDLSDLINPLSMTNLFKKYPLVNNPKTVKDLQDKVKSGSLVVLDKS